MKYLLQYFLPGAGLILIGFWAGSQPNKAMGLLAFLPFFTLGVILIIEGRKKSKSP